jgi:hypothetical protein
MKTIALMVAVLLFSVAASLAAQTTLDPQQEATAPDEVEEERQVRRMRSDEANLELEIPENWQFRVIQDGSYFFEGPEGSEEAELAVLIQFLDKSNQPAASTLAQLGEGLRRVLALPQAELKRLDLLQAGGQIAPFFVATYGGQDSQGNQVPFGHMQMVLDHGQFYYWLSFLGPRDVYDQHSEVFQLLLSSLSFPND